MQLYRHARDVRYGGRIVRVASKKPLFLRPASMKYPKRIQEYIPKQLQEDATADQISMKEYIDPLRVSRRTKARNKAALAVARVNHAVGRLFDALASTCR